jgi:ribosomal protein S18 acetylase RimI-like enzyme
MQSRDRRRRGPLDGRRIWLITTNNNVRAIRFYQLIGMDLCAFYRDGVSASRR